MIITVKNKDTLIFDDFVFKCCVGKNGLTNSKIEGDKKTPKGLFKLDKLYLRNDRLNIPKTKLEVNYIKKNNPLLLSTNYIPNFTAGITFFIAVAATNLFHQGNWQRVYAAKNFEVLKKSLVISFFIIIPIVFFMGFSGLVAVSQDTNVIPDLAFLSILLKENLIIFSIIVIILAISLTISSIDTLINAISSLVIVDVDKIFNLKNNQLNISKQFVIFLSVIAFFVASKGFSILYLFLIADLFCCAAVLSVFYTFYSKSYDEKNAYVSILIGLIAGLLFFPSPDFSKSILFGIILPMDLAPSYISQSLLFCSFIAATLSPIIAWKLK